MPRRVLLSVVAVSWAVSAAVAPHASGAAARPARCTFGGPTPGAHVIRAELAHATDFLELRLTGAPPSRPVGDRSSWHHVQGVAVVDERTGELVAARVIASGSSPRRVVLRAGAASAAPDVAGPDAPFVHRGGTPVAGVDAGRYLVVAFGSDGDPRLPNPAWGAEIRSSGALACAPAGSGVVFDVDHTGFSGGTAAAAYGAGVVRDATFELRTARRFVFGLIDAATQVAGDAAVSYELPGGRRGRVADTTVPFSSRGGVLRFRADAAGLFPMALVAGVAFDA